MTDLDTIENKISILEEHIEFEDIIDDFLSESYDEVELETIDKLEYRKNKVDELKHRFTNIYDLDILNPENGYSILNVGNDKEIKKYLHRFLTYKTLTGGTGANQDGSAQLFEEISANSVCNFLGTGSKSILVGEGHSALSTNALETIAKKLKEPSGVFNNLPKQAKDDGVDFIVYKPIDNRNVGNIIILGQACIGTNYNKKKPIHKRWTNKYITYAVHPPTKLLSIVCFLESDKLKAVHSEFGDAIVFDRGRIIKYYNIKDTVLNAQIIDFVRNKITED